MNISTSECSSGCESGWTTYLNQFSNSTTNPYTTNYEEEAANVMYGNQEDDDDQDEDLSMVSDASSGPPNLHQNYAFDPHYYAYASPAQQDHVNHTKKSNQKSRTKETKAKKQHMSFCLDDTATSPILHFSKDNAAPHEYNNSTASLFDECESIPKKRLGFFKSSTKGKSGSFLGRKRQ